MTPEQIDKQSTRIMRDMFRQETVNRLRLFVRKNAPVGKCKMLSMGVGCVCPLCDLERLTGTTRTEDAKKVPDVDHLAGLEEEITRTDRMIQMKVAMDYLAQLIDPKYRQAFQEAERSAKTIEEMNRIIDLAKKFIAQRTLVDIMGIE